MTMRYYLGKSGKITGPFSVEELEELRRTGGISAYSWIWLEGSPAWETLDPPPPLPMRAGEVPVPEPAPAQPQLRPLPHERAPAQAAVPIERMPSQPLSRRAPAYIPCDLEALCHDRHSVVTGRLARVTEQGGELVSPERLPAPVLAARSRATLNLLDPASGRAVNVSVRVGTATRRGGSWVYPLRWSECPALIAANSAA